MIGPWLWAYYFAAKLGLHAAGVISVHFLPNFALAALALPFKPRGTGGKDGRSGLFAAALAVAAAALAWYDSYLPPFWYSVKFAAENPQVLRSGFLHTLVGGVSLGWPVLAAAAVLGLFLYGAKRGLHPTPIVLAALLLVPAQALRVPAGEVAARVQRFYESERERRVEFPQPKGPAFDVIVIHICSLAWDDLRAAGVEKPRLLEGAGVVFTGFNSATSYSTPAGLRVLRAPCGQVSHADLYRPWPKDCGLLPALEARGFRAYTALNYDRASFGMYADIHRLAGAPEPVPVDGVPLKLLNFDDERILQDGPVLQRWLAARVRSGEPRAVLYYNTVSLHGGAHRDVPEWWKEPSLPLYAKTLDEMAADVEALQSGLTASGRSAVVLIVPEHGRAFRGSAIQSRDLRDIPLGRITRVPVAVRFVGPAFAGAATGLRSDAPVSYLALARLLSDVLADPSLPADRTRLEKEVASLPATERLSETEQWKVYERGGDEYVFGKDGQWRKAQGEAAETPAPGGVAAR